MSGVQPHNAWIGLGSNIGDRLKSIEDALQALGDRADIDLCAVSSCWETSPVGPVDQDRYLNAVARLRTDLIPRQLLQCLLATEETLGRVRLQRWGPRVIDLDILLFGNQVIDEEGLTIPHPYLTRRRFVLTPLIELCPGLRNPLDGTRLIDNLRQLPAGEEQVRPTSPLRLPPGL
ncbi:MAG: 2-amino-4-hydroxy-6-hydroxymethyldihydropteridine diphosphokinase [Gemmatimonadetes bacterium]|jgi:2-amino-4-hydroxy-6-hydroxymethyldihydropteridine diphosphokinase|nr:2-amino-4-hydroxy-6-hydroxymethyldihydropteridine diphosphokinase [Gemmatimonadota bacterium]MBT5055592.1 2-amino-4-hydroxy-6-hydroxymethyldihydropteridine diphosphokinase [Gemmatimonadota bacterium]MBT5143940.1 2-amino-4-hydroxy-6-hydroxymethyldihydropteridine diphosphokinase [Gemmatimonadota bacterium]MBT5588621.1 2-amino-4-hydroxy-6-hydroxymethyldihydropteridine diphosphokinase [Gemmatimonadota bacterium]MBT5962489.1 2-amino-4-hydroxy-6-hydroxymethyldihydropteridine diphosphokinase [Gemma